MRFFLLALFLCAIVCIAIVAMFVFLNNRAHSPF